MKRFPLIFGIVLMVLGMHASLTEAYGAGIRTVVIDPGHGGRDSGAIGRQSEEKEITLAISLKVGEYIREHLPEVEVIFTRETDVFVPLHERAQIANENNADLFLSIHCNSSSSSRARGTETFVMGLHRSEANLEVARRENKSILYEEDYLETYDGFDPHSPEASIIFALYQNAYLEQSLDMAAFVQGQFRERANRIDRGVKQAGFLVLYHITMPGILIETGFLSNPSEEQYLMSESGQAYIASAIFRAFRDYKYEQDALYVSRDKNQYNDAPGDSGGRAEQNTERSDLPPLQGKEAQTENGTSTDPFTTDEPETPTVFFRVQFASTTTKRPHDDPAFNGLSNVSSYYHEGLYKYTVGNETSLEEAGRLQQAVQQAGFRDAFVVAFLNEERISAAEALKHLNKQGAE